MKSVRVQIWVLLMVLGLGFTACDQEQEEDMQPTVEVDPVKKAIVDVMREWYYWNEEIPKNLDINQFSSNTDLLNAMRFRPTELDRFSYLTTPAAFNASFTGQATGVHGFSFAMNPNEELFVAFVFNDGPAGKAGWQRGWQILEINNRPIASYKNAEGRYVFDLGPNTVGVTNSFKIRKPDGQEILSTIGKEDFQSNSVLHQSVINVDNKRVGYWAYQSFRATPNLTPTRSLEVQQSFEFFQAQGINELIIDLRYNGGGSVAVAEQILNYVIKPSDNGKQMYVNRHNVQKSGENRVVNFSKIGNLNLNRIVFITTRSSASASELIINSLTPYMDVVLIGDNTFGKPVGSFPLSRFNRTLSNNNIEVVPITFAIANASGRADYFEGFPPNFRVGDDTRRNWGDPQEGMLAAALEYIRSGNISTRTANYYRPKWEMIDAFEGLQKEFPMY